MLVAIIITIVFIVGLVMFIKALPGLKEAAKKGWKEGSPKKK